MRVLLTAGVLTFLSAVRALWRYLTGANHRQPFVTLYMSPDSAALRRENGGSEKTLAELLVEKVPALWPDVRFDSPWYLPRYACRTVYSAQ